LIDSHPSFVRNPFSYFAEFVRGSPTCFGDDLRKCVVCASPVMVACEAGSMPAGSHSDACLKHPSLVACKTSGAHTCIQALQQLCADFSNERAGRCETVRLCRDLANPGAFNAAVYASLAICSMILMDLDGVTRHHPLRWRRRWRPGPSWNLVTLVPSPKHVELHNDRLSSLQDLDPTCPHTF